MPTTTSVLKQNAPLIMQRPPGSASPQHRKYPLSPLIITPMPSHHHNQHSNHHNQQQLQQQLQLQQQQQQFSPLLGSTPTATSPHSPNSVLLVRTTKTSRLRAAALDKKKDEELHQQQRYSSPTSPRRQKLQSPRQATSTGARHSSCSDNNQKSPSNSEGENKNSATSSPTRRLRLPSATESSPTRKKLVPSMSVSMKQNLSELHFNGVPHIPASSNATNAKLTKQRPQTAECTIKITGIPRSASSTVSVSDASQFGGDEVNEIDDGLTRPRCSTMYADESNRNSTKSSTSGRSKENSLELSPVPKARTLDSCLPRHEDRDKSSKRKSNLNRSQNEEATQDGDETAALRRRRRRELGMARQLIPSDDPALREIISPQKTSSSATFTVGNKTDSNATFSPPRSMLAYHMECARRGLDSLGPASTNNTTFTTSAERRRAQTASPKIEEMRPKPDLMTAASAVGGRVNRRSDTLPLGGGELRKLRSKDVNRKMNERTKSDLAEIMKIVELANDESSALLDRATSLSDSINRMQLSHPTRSESPKKTKARESPVKHATFVKEEQRVYYPPESPTSNECFPDEIAGTLMHNVVKTRSSSSERDRHHDPAKLSPILRRKSTTDALTNTAAQQSSTAASTAASPSTSAQNHIVSILKKKDHIGGESSSASSNASPVTFSLNVVDTPRKQKRAGILKKRSSLDESRYYSRSHSPDERSILIKSARRNSLEETAAAASQQQQHGILKQSSYDSNKSDGCPSAGTESTHPHGILKKKDSSSTPSDGASHAPKHVSISQAVILAAAELYRESADAANGAELEEVYTPSNEEYEIRPILKLECASNDDAVRHPKPILKKKSSSGESDEHEIRPILKTSRKSSREEFDLSGLSSDELRQLSEPSMRPILKTESPSKRRSLGGVEAEAANGRAEATSPGLLKRRTRSLERQDAAPVVDLAAALDAISTTSTTQAQAQTPVDFFSTPAVSMSVAERIKSMEKFLTNKGSSPVPPSADAAANTSWESPLQSGAVPKLLKPSAIKRDMYRDRYKTQPVTDYEKDLFKATSLPFDTSATSAFKPTKSLDALNYIAFANQQTALAAAPTSASSYAFHPLTRSCTQPSTVGINYSSSTSPPPRTPNKPLRSVGYNDYDGDDTSISITEQLTLSVGSDGDRIFDMSSIDQDSSMPDGQNDADAVPPPAGGIVRKNSVRARANMFQELQKQQARAPDHSREERTSPRRAAPRRLSPSASPAIITTTSTALNHDEPKTPNNPPPLNSDDEIEPSSLPLSERLRFFSSLSAVRNNSNAGSYTRSPPYSSIERSASASSYSFYLPGTPRSSTSSTSVTPTPMECTPSSNESCSSSANETDSTPITEETVDHATDPEIVKTSAFLTLAKAKSYSGLTGHAMTPTSTLTPITKRIKLKTIGRLMLPKTFLGSNNDRNNNTEPSSAGIDGEKLVVKKIGKIKSPFIENCQQMQQKQQINSKCMKYDLKSTPHNALSSLENSDTDGNAMRKTNGITPGSAMHQNGRYDANTDSGKENDVTAAVIANTPPVVEMRKKFTRIVSSSMVVTGSATSINRQNLHQPQRNTYSARQSASGRSPLIDDKYAKYFGLATKEKQTQESNSTVSVSVVKRNMQNMPDVCLVTPKSAQNDADAFMQDMSEAKTPIAAAVNRNVRYMQTSTPTTPVGAVSQEISTPISCRNGVVHTPSSSATLKRREMIKRGRAQTTIVSTTISTTVPFTPDGAGTPGVGVGSASSARSLRARALTITHGVQFGQQVPEVKKFEDIVVTKEEFQLASKEFERIFVGIV